MLRKSKNCFINTCVNIFRRKVQNLNYFLKYFSCLFWEVSHQALTHRLEQVFHISLLIHQRIVDLMVASLSRSISPTEEALIHKPFQSIYDREPEHENATYALGIAFFELGRFAEAKQMLEKATMIAKHEKQKYCIKEMLKKIKS